MYDPNHINADWGGYVSIQSTKKHFDNNNSGSLEANLVSVTPNLNALTSEWSKPSRKIIPHIESGTEISCKNQQDKELRSATFDLIGGPLAGDCWETEARSASRREKTGLHQLTDKGRSMCIRGKKPKPEMDTTVDTYCTSEPKVKGSVPSASHDTNDRDFVGFRGRVQSCASDPSILKEICDKFNEMKFSGEFGKYKVTTAPYATEGNKLPTDPYLSSNGNRCKNLLVENFTYAVPGYSGKRRNFPN